MLLSGHLKPDRGISSIQSFPLHIKPSFPLSPAATHALCAKVGKGGDCFVAAPIVIIMTSRAATKLAAIEEKGSPFEGIRLNNQKYFITQEKI